MPSLLENEIQAFRGPVRIFLLLRISGLSRTETLHIGNIPEPTYDSWLKNPVFRDFNRRVDSMTAEYQRQAILLLRRNNQLKAVLFEGKVLDKMEEEIKNGKYHIIKTEIGKIVYSKLLSELDFTPATNEIKMTWEQKINNIVTQGEVAKKLTEVATMMTPVELDDPPTKYITEGEVRELQSIPELDDEELGSGDTTEIRINTPEQPATD
jgi:hypothetical protein